jgi:radical SAM superfamily enzyme YgiQ (UPF0313 family)
LRIALVNTNRIKPPIAPIGIDYLTEVLRGAGHWVRVLDLCWADEPAGAISGFFDETAFDLVGLTLRNTDDCAFASRQSFLGEFARIVDLVRRHTDAFLVVGGVGFSVMPESVLDLCRADAGVWGAGESAFSEMVRRMESHEEWRDVPNLIWSDDGGWRRNPSVSSSPLNLPPMNRRGVDNRRYFSEGGQAGIETKRGCPQLCIYCADPMAKGKRIRLRPPENVGYEIQSLLEQGIDHLHTCDSEFNMPVDHAAEVCRELIRSNLAEKIRWYAYCSPRPFTAELASLMRRAGCVGINFGVDNGDEGMLKRLGRSFGPADIMDATRLCRSEGIAVMLDLLLGSPGETRESITHTVEMMREAGPDQVGVSLGVRVYPGTALADLAMREELRDGLTGGEGPEEPLFFMEPAIAPFAFSFLDSLIGDDDRFFFFDPQRPERNYNYNANQRLEEAIRKGYRGAYWDILRRYR